MGSKLHETRRDHLNRPLPAGIYALTKEDGTIVSFKARWREEDANGILRNAAKSFAIRKHKSPDHALEAAAAYRAKALSIVAATGTMPRPDPAAGMTVGELFREWCVKRGAALSQRYAEDAVKRWDREIAPRPIAKMRLERLSRDPSMIARFHDELELAGLTASNRTQILKILRAVLRWGRRRHPNALSIELSGLFELPPQSTNRLAYTADAYGIERIIEAVSRRPSHDALHPIRDAALVAAMGFTIAARPSEWLYSATWADLHENSVELQRPRDNVELETNHIGLKTGARAALLLPNAYDRITKYRNALTKRFGIQPSNGLIFQAHNAKGPAWTYEGKKKLAPVAWTYNDYKRWTARVWRPARVIAAQAKDAPIGLTSMRFYDCRHTAISMALHSTLVMGPHGMNLHNLAGWAGHDVQTLQRYYAHIIARYQAAEPIDLKAECAMARARIEANPLVR